MSERLETIAVLAELMRVQLGFAHQPPRIFIYNSGWKIPTQDWLFLELACLTDREYGASLKYDPNDPVNGLDEIQTSNQQVLYSIDLFSRNTEARARRQEVRFALQGTVAEQAMEKHGIRIGRPTQFQDISHVEGGSRLNRWTAQFNVLEAASSVRPVLYFDQFQIPPAPILINQ